MFFFRKKKEPIAEYLESCKTIAIVGLSDDPDRASYRIASYLQDKGYKIVPVNPNVEEVLGEKAYPDLLSIPFAVDIVDVFRSEEHLDGVIKEAIDKRVPCIWLQLGLVSLEGAALAGAQGILFIQDRCLMQEHRRLIG